MLEKVRTIALGVIEPALAHLKPAEIDILLATLEAIRTNLLTTENDNAGHSETTSQRN